MSISVDKALEDAAHELHMAREAWRRDEGDLQHKKDRTIERILNAQEILTASLGAVVRKQP